MTPTPPKHFLSGWAMKLTILRMVLIPLFIFTYYCHPHSWGQWLSLGVYTIACLSDFFDGWLARHLKEESAFGAFLRKCETQPRPASDRQTHHAAALRRAC